jgi:lipid II:glycine glycyltransferase (peptidoglycan interpeptide bridge formation enzyme)
VLIKFGDIWGYSHKLPVLGYTIAKILFPQSFSLNYIQELCDRYGIAMLEITITNKQSIPEKYLSNIGATFVIDLTNNIEQLWKSLNQKTRNEIRQAEKRNVVINQCANQEEFEMWLDIYKSTSIRKGFTQEPEYMIRKIYNDRKLSHLFIAKVDGDIAAGAMILKKDYPIWWLGATDEKYSWHRANNLLKWEIIKWAKSQNYYCYDMGGTSERSDINAGPDKFKKGFGGEYKELYVYQFPIKYYKSKIVKLLLIGYALSQNLRNRLKKVYFFRWIVSK